MSTIHGGLNIGGLLYNLCKCITSSKLCNLQYVSEQQMKKWSCRVHFRHTCKIFKVKYMHVFHDSHVNAGLIPRLPPQENLEMRICES